MPKPTVKVRPFAEFTSTLPEDGVEDESDWGQLPGRNVADAVGEIFRRIGCNASAPMPHPQHGWDIIVKCGDRRLFCVVTLIERYLLQVSDLALFSKNWPRNRALFCDALQRFAAEAAKDERFVDLQWYDRSDMLTDAPGTREPVIRLDA